MTNAPKTPATPKTVAEKAAEKTVPAQATGETPAKGDQVLDNKGKVLFSGAPDEVKNWLLEQSTMIYAVRKETNNDLVVSTVYVEEQPLKLTLAKRVKAAAEKLKQNKKALLILGGAAVVVGLTVKNNRKAVSAEDEDQEATLTHDESNGDAPDSL